MPSVAITIEDFSPLLFYSLDWSQGGGESDSQISKYSASSFFATKTTGGTATFSFTGTGIEIFGSKRSNHGNYQVQLDGTSFPIQSGTAPDPGTFQTSLFSRTSLSDGLHTITLANQGTNNQFLDIDFITLRSSIGRIDEKLIINTVQDTDPAFVYSPASSWSDTSDSQGTFSGGSGHSTSDGAMTFTFEGDAVSLYGPVGPTVASYAVQVDGGTTSAFSATKSRFQPGVLLYRGSNLGPGKHNLKFFCRPGTGQVCSVDYAEVYTTESIQQRSSGSQSKPASTGAIVGIVIGALVFVGILLFVLFWYLRRHRKQKRQENQDFLPATVIAPHPSFRESPQVMTNARPTSSSMYSHRSGPLPNPYPESTSHDLTYNAGSFTHILSPSVTIKDSGNNPSLMSPNSAVSEDETASSSTRSYSRRTVGGRSITNSTSPRLQPRTTSLMKGQDAPPLPISAGQSFNIPDDELRANRLAVEGRPQDFGSLPERGDAGGNNSQYIENNPPPDYSQATQPYQGIAR